MKSVNQAVRSLTSEEIDAFEASGSIDLDLGDEGIVALGVDDVEITSHGIEGWQVEQVNGVTVALDTEVTRELRLEGLAREFTNRVQTMRKAADFNVVDRIYITHSAEGELAEALSEHAGWIRNETLARELEFDGSPEGERVEQFQIGRAAVTIGVRRIG
jgi:isoleucyl-tRNA synthetase